MGERLPYLVQRDADQLRYDGPVPQKPVSHGDRDPFTGRAATVANSLRVWWRARDFARKQLKHCERRGWERLVLEYKAELAVIEQQIARVEALLEQEKVR